METDTLAPDIVTTKEELEKWKEKRARQRGGDGEPTHPPHLESRNYKAGGWQDDVNLLVQFLKGLKTLMRFLIEHRVPEKPSRLFAECLDEVEENINKAISDLYDIDSDTHAAYLGLQARECTAKPLKLKIREYYRSIVSRPLPAVLERIDSILRSLFPVLATLEPVNEFKEALESRIKHDGDREIISLNLSGYEQSWNQAVGEE